MRFGTENLGRPIGRARTSAGAVDGISDQIIHFNNKQFFFGLNESGTLSFSAPFSMGGCECVYSNGNLEGVA